MKKFSFWIRIFLSVGLLAFLLTTVDLGEAAELVSGSNGWYILLTFLLGVVDRALMAYKWNLLLRVKNIHISTMTALFIYWKTTFLGLFLPATVGGDALRAYALSRKNYPLGEVVSSIIIERALGFLSLFVMVLISLTLSLFVFGQNFFSGMADFFWFFLLLSVVSLAALYFTMRQATLDRLGGFINQRAGRFAQNKIAHKVRDIVKAYGSYRDNLGVLVVFFLLSMLENLFPLMWAYLLSLAFGIDVPLLYFFILIPIVLVLIRLPISLDGFGIKEGAFVYFLGLIGIGSSEAFLLGFSSHLLTLLIVLPGGLFYALQGIDMPENNTFMAQAAPPITSETG